ncbi:Cytidine deaminase 1 [Raphanus sativus]|uniref:cytidine deaminase n=1 Tax=Raphanus sativus TaxID=3726 RepID=A0A6J0NJH6_RAPSA|nr:cytidine deaminase 1 [Raphanus sativus]XP_056865530.1 cytidine deaminase 1-like [Raphanus sativus]KAJ4867378.1 Cytidine deaminase 1 [Raphanus sativus]KAJ4899336.1 Cytidine deaminase 1 [Raphanus sativus]
MDRPSFLIHAEEAESAAKRHGVSVVNLLPLLVNPAKPLARPPISKFPVSAVGLGSSGRIFVGVNVEFPGLPLHHSIHAEQFLVTNLALNSEPILRRFSVSAAPCGHCRQFLQEIRDAPDIRILITDPNAFRDAVTDNEDAVTEKNDTVAEKENAVTEQNDTVSTEQNDTVSTERNDAVAEKEDGYVRLESILPHRFGPDDLLERDVPLLLEPHDNRLTLLGVITNGHTDSDLKLTALSAANRSYAPYSRCPSGVAMVDCEGRVYRGWYMESAAYNPSLGPVQAALVDFVANGGGGGGFERIVGAVLVEKRDAVVRQEHTAKMLLQVIAPKCDFEVFHC